MDTNTNANASAYEINTNNTNTNMSNASANANMSEMNASADIDNIEQFILKKYSYSIILFKNIHILYKKLNFIKQHIKKIADSYILV